MKRFGLTLFFVGIFLLAVRNVSAHGGGTLQVVNAPIADAYQVSVWSAPVTVRAQDDIHITVGVGSITDGSPMLDTAVQVDIYSFESNELIASEPALTENSINRLFYEADFVGLPQGDYDVVVTVVGDEGSGDIAFELNIRPFLNLPLIIGATVIVILFIGTGLLVFRRQQSDKDDRQPARRRNSKAKKLT